MLYKHLKFYDIITTNNNNIYKNDQINKLLRENKSESYLLFEMNYLFFAVSIIVILSLLLLFIGCKVRKTKITQVNQQNIKDENKNENKYHIIEHIVINVLPNSFSFGLFQRKKTKTEKDIINEKYEKELEYLKKIV